MKYFIIIFVVFSLVLSHRNTYSQDTNIVKYLPLKIGNVWVYSWQNVTSGKQRISISNTVFSNGHIFYVMNFSTPYCVCMGPTNALLTNWNDTLRIDSLTGNILALQNPPYYCPSHPNDYIFDSLYLKKSDPRNTCTSYPCWDTSTQNVFGFQKKTKSFGYMIPNYSRLIQYAMDIGVIYSYRGCWIAGACGFNLTGCVIDGVSYGDTTFPVGVNQISSVVPKSFSLYQNYPNPFNPGTKIKFDIPSNVKSDKSNVKLIIYDALGREVATLVNEPLNPGTYEVEWDASNYPSGVYFYKYETQEYSETKRMVLIK